MSIEHGLPAVTPEAPQPTAEQQEVFAAALPILHAIRDAKDVAVAHMPADHETLSGKTVIIEPYYGFRTDRHQIGHWGLTSQSPEDEKPWRAMVSSEPEVRVTRRGAETTTEADFAEAAHILGMLVADQSTDITRIKPQRRGSALSRWLNRRAPHN